MRIKFEYVLPKEFFILCPEERRMREIIDEELRKLADVLEPPEEAELIIRYQLFSDTDVIAMFLPIESAKYRWILLISISSSVGKGFTNRIQEMNRAIFHELVHIADRKVIRENYQVYVEHKRANMIDVDHPDKLDPSLLGFLLDFFATIRNEGVVLLAERMFGHTDTPVDFNPLNLFSDDLTMALDLIASHDLSDRIPYQQINGLFYHLRKRIYSYADALQAVQVNLLKDNEAQLLNEKIQISSYEQRLEWLHAGLQMDLSEWIRRLLFDPKNRYLDLLEQRSLKKLIDVLNGIGSDHGFSAQLFLKGCAKDQAGFHGLIESKISVPLTTRMLTAHLDQLNKKKHKSLLHKDIVELYSELFNEFKRTGDTQIQLALSYVVKQRDYIDDEIPFFGLQDDWLVLEGIRQIQLP
jgi:hypothetical protein